MDIRSRLYNQDSATNAESFYHVEVQNLEKHPHYLPILSREYIENEMREPLLKNGACYCSSGNSCEGLFLLGARMKLKCFRYPRFVFVYIFSIFF